MYRPINHGYIEVVIGPMYSGKSEELIRRLKRAKIAKQKVLVFKPKIDDRYSKEDVVSHSQRRVKSIAVNKSSEILDSLDHLPYAVAIDEAQFFDFGIIEVAEYLADHGVRVIVAGLDCDFRGEPFGVMPDFLARAEYVTKLQAICQVCGEPATRTQRIIDGHPAYEDDPIILVGATEAYEPRCRKCHMVLKRDK